MSLQKERSIFRILRFFSDLDWGGGGYPLISGIRGCTTQLGVSFLTLESRIGYRLWPCTLELGIVLALKLFLFLQLNKK